MVKSLKDFMPQMGTGPRSSEDLNYSQASDAMRLMLSGSVEPTSFGAFTVAERWKSQTPDELSAFLDVVRSTNFNSLSFDREFFLDVAGRFDGKARSVNTDLAGSILAVASGIPIFTHASRNIPTQEATTILDITNSLGWKVHPDPDLTRKALDEYGFSYSHQKVYAPELEKLRPLRREVGVRTFLNTVESMANPADAPVHVGSFYHLPFAKRVCDTFNQSETVDLDRIIMIQGIEGQTEFRPGSSLMAEWKDDELSDREVKTSEFGLNYDRDQLEEIGSEPKKSADLTFHFLKGEDVPDAFQESALLNGAVKVYAGSDEMSLEESVDKVRTNLRNRSAFTLFNELNEVFKNE